MVNLLVLLLASCCRRCVVGVVFLASCVWRSVFGVLSLRVGALISSLCWHFIQHGAELWALVFGIGLFVFGFWRWAFGVALDCSLVFVSVGL